MSILAPLRSSVSLEQLFVNCAGWKIPAVLEQSLNSDLPGEIKALVMSNVYDTATGRSSSSRKDRGLSANMTHAWHTARMGSRLSGIESAAPEVSSAAQPPSVR